MTDSSDLIRDLREAAKAVRREIRRFNRRLAEMADELNEVTTGYNDLLVKAETYRTDTVTRISDDYDRNFVKRRETVEAMEVRMRLGKWREAEFSPLDINLPRALDVPDMDAAKRLEELETE